MRPVIVLQFIFKSLVPLNVSLFPVTGVSAVNHGLPQGMLYLAETRFSDELMYRTLEVFFYGTSSFEPV